MEFNLVKGIKGQARRLAQTIRNMSPKVVDVGQVQTNPVSLNKSKLLKKIDKYYKGDGTKADILKEQISTILKDKVAKESRYKQQDKLSKESTYNVLLTQFMEDAFGIDPDDQVVSVEILDDDPEIRSLLEVFPNDALLRTELDEILTDNLKNTFLKYGELFLKKHFDRKGLVTKLEILEGQYVYPICNSSEILFFLIIDPLTNDFSIEDPNTILAFQLNPENQQIVSADSNSNLEKILAEYPEELRAEIPNAYKLGTPLLYNARNELGQLRLANLLSNLGQLKSLAMPSILAVNIENIRDEEQLSELIDTYEEYLEDAIDIPDLNPDEDLNLEDMINTNVKVIPVEGSGKNGLSPIDLGTVNSTTDDSYIEKLKESVALASGFPLSALSVQSNETSKSDLSSNRRYRNKCKAGQRFIVRPIRKWLLDEFEILDIDISPEQLRVFCKPIVSLDTAEDLEIALGAITQASQVYEALMVISENSQEYTIDEDGYYDYFNELLGSFKGAKKLLKKRNEEVAQEDTLDDEPFTPVKSPSIDIDTSIDTDKNNLDRSGIDIPEGGGELTDTTETEFTDTDNLGE